MSSVAAENLLGFNLKPLTLKELATAFDVLRHLDEALDGFTCQPRCRAQGTRLNQAGELLTHLGERISAEKTEIVNEAGNRVPKTEDERALRFYILASDDLWGHGAPEEMMGVVQSIITATPPLGPRS